MRTAALLVTLLGLATSAVAQDLPRERRDVFSLAVGTDIASIRDASQWSPSLWLQGSYWLPQHTDHLRFRLTGNYLHHTNHSLGYVGTTVAVGVNAELAAFVSRSGLGLYGIAGAGLYHTQLDMSGPAVGGFTVQRTSPGLVAGVGYVARLGSVTPFVEARVTRFTRAAGVGWGVVPLTVGFRF